MFSCYWIKNTSSFDNERFQTDVVLQLKRTLAFSYLGLFMGLNVAEV
jgi:hypothetical protein